MTENQGTPTQELVTVMQPYEAGFSTNFFMIHPMAGRQQFTFRGAFATDWHLAMEEAAAFVKDMRVKGWKLEGELNGVAPEKPAQATQAPQTPAPTQEAPVTPQAPAGQGFQTMSITRLEIEPQADGKAKMKFYATGHKYPDLYSTLPIGNCIAVLADTGAWTQEHFEKAGSYDINWLVDWKNSEKLNGKGNPYKDLIKVRLP